MDKWKGKWRLLGLVLCLALLITGSALASNQNLQQKLTDLVKVEQQSTKAAADATLDIAAVVSTSMVPGEEARYIVSFSSPATLDLKDAKLTLDLPDGFSIVQNGILDENPGCTLANLQYKNSDSDKYWSFLQGQTAVSTKGGKSIFTLQIQTSSAATVNAGRTIYLTLPGVINAPDEGTFPVNVLLETTTQNYQGMKECTLGAAPNEAPAELEVQAIDSYTINAKWDTVEGASSYQLYFALDPHGEYVQACDFGNKDPGPDEIWQLNDTFCTFTAKGNGGLEPGRTYYFKVKAGNEYGFGPFSRVIKVETPALRLKAPEENPHSPITVRLDQNVEIADEDLILIYIAATGEPVPATVAALDDTVSISADLKSGTKYQVVFYKNALISTGHIKAVNNLFGFEFVAGRQPSK